MATEIEDTTTQSETTVSEPTQPQGGPRIVVNPSTFKNEKDALCVAFNEAFRVLMEYNGFDPVSEPTDEQRRFFADTAYADDELQLRRTILARICTFDTSVKDPTDEQLQEAVEFLETVMEIGAPQNEWEQSAVQRLRDMVAKVVEDGDGDRVPPPEEIPPPSPEGASTQADEGGGGAQEDEERRIREEAEARAAAARAEAEEDRRELAAAEQEQTASGRPDGFMAGSTFTGRQLRDMQRYNRSSASDRESLTEQFAQNYGLSGLVNMEAGGILSAGEAVKIAAERMEDAAAAALGRSPGLAGNQSRLGEIADAKALALTRDRMAGATRFGQLDPARRRIEADADARAAGRAGRDADNIVSTAAQRASRNVAARRFAEARAGRDADAEARRAEQRLRDDERRRRDAERTARTARG